ISVGTIDPKMEALYAKYVADDRLELVQKADLDKVEICEKGNIPYFEYDNDEGGWLVKKIHISKSDILKLSEIFSQMPDNKEFTLVCCQGTFEYLYLDTPNGKQYVYAGA
ncbi:MAG: hypothetical protein LUH11_03470, partial [Candidatus Gastranaerophilales bacterium]|nr:hypothetical protein [Candidatus Gastranaerophilales bacterium]